MEAGPANIKRRKMEDPGSWRPTAVLRDREAFANSIFSNDKHIILERFNDVVFGINALFRNALVGGNEKQGSEYNKDTRAEFGQKISNSPINFRTLLVTC